MKKVKIVTDSACTMIKSVRDELDIHAVPLSVMVDGVVYRDDAITSEQFMEMMAKAKALPKTSQPPIGEFAEIFDELGKDGSDIISIHMTQGLSGTVEAARQASNLTASNVTVIDSDTVDQGQAFQVIKAARMAQAGASADEIIDEVKRISGRTKLYVGIAGLDNLVKGGRISRATGLLSNVLNIKAVMDFYHSELVPVAKGRGNKTFTKWFDGLKKEMSSFKTVHAIGISHAGAEDLAESFKRELLAMFPDIEIPVLWTCPIIATHTGPGAFAVTYYTD